MSGCFYAFEDEDEARAVLPGLFVAKLSGDGFDLTGAILRATNGVWLERPVYEQGEDGPVETTPGTLSAPYVLLTEAEHEGAAVYRIDPPGEQGLA